MRNINIINPSNFIKSFEDYQCGRSHVAQISSKDFEIKKEETQPLKGYQAPDNFPNSCPSLFDMAFAKFHQFPNCCDGHKRLKNAAWFSKINYAYLPYKLISTIHYTWDCISRSINNPDWYKQITDYIEYTANSYGQLPDGYGEPVGLSVYLHNIINGIEESKDILEPKKKQLLLFMKKYWEKEEVPEHTDINLLIGTYKEWFSIFPFELSFLSHLKPHFEKQLPIMKGKGETNIYSGFTGFHLKTKKELITFLTSVTMTIIKAINTRNLYEQGLLTDINKTRLEVLMSQRKVEMEALNKIEWNDRKEYVKLLNRWLKGEKSFLKELSELTPPSFIKDFVDGIKLLQKNDETAECIKTIKENKPNKEASFRNWFKIFFTARYSDYVITAEEEQRAGRIDLKVYLKSFGEKIIEFKGWWNKDKPEIIQQTCGYLTEFDTDGYTFMINHTKSSIDEKYKQIITENVTGYIDGSWHKHDKGFLYFESKHQVNSKIKTLYHFIFNVYF